MKYLQECEIIAAAVCSQFVSFGFNVKNKNRKLCLQFAEVGLMGCASVMVPILFFS